MIMSASSLMTHLRSVLLCWVQCIMDPGRLYAEYGSFGSMLV